MTESLRVKEIYRKILHIVLSLSPLAAGDLAAIQFFYFLGIILYFSFAILNSYGFRIPVISNIMVQLGRKTIPGHFDSGPLSLFMGCMVCFWILPADAASFGVISLAFSDSAAALVGKSWGRIALPFRLHKTLEGSIACFTTLWILGLTHSGQVIPSLFIAAIGALTEAYAPGESDNLFVPLLTGIAFSILG